MYIIILRMIKLRHLLIFIYFIITSYGCVKFSIINENEPDGSRVYSDADALINMAGESFRTIHNQMQEYSGLALNMACMADNTTMPWGITRDLSWEPRTFIEGYNNSPEYAYYYQLMGQWEGSYKAISHSNNILRYLYTDAGEVTMPDDQRVLLEAFSWFVSGVAHGYLGLIFDKALVVNYDSNPEEFKLVSWDEVIKESLKMIDRAIEISDANYFEIPAEWVGSQVMTNVEFSQLANSYAARIMAYCPRNSLENSRADWNRVLEYASKGINQNFAPELGGAYDFYDFYWFYSTYPGWGRVDHRIINLMDHDYPSHWPRDGFSWNTPDGNDPGPADPDDDRLLTDFEYLEFNDFPPNRGYYHFSHYRYKRYNYVREEVWYGSKPKPSFLAWENKLIEAEALYRTGNIVAAVAILNDPAGPRKVRGQLPDVNQATDDVLRLILDEKEIECYGTGAGVSFFDMRRTDRLQKGTLLHFPVPATELELIGEPYYTIYSEAFGTDSSNGGWTGYDEE